MKPTKGFMENISTQSSAAPRSGWKRVAIGLVIMLSGYLLMPLGCLLAVWVHHPFDGCAIAVGCSVILSVIGSFLVKPSGWLVIVAVLLGLAEFIGVAYWVLAGISSMIK